MALPVKTDLITLDFGFDGVPFCAITAAGGTGYDTKTLDFGFDGVPFLGADTSAPGGGGGGAGSGSIIVISS